MINFNNIQVKRMIIHTIIEKKDTQDCATVRPSSEMLEAEGEVLEIIKTRLIDAAGKNSKAFELKLEDVSRASFYDICKELNHKDDTEFIEESIRIAELLANNQKRKTIPGGYLIIIDCINEDDLELVIVIKAEPHEALQHQYVEGHSQVQLLKKVFLSPSQKLYKIGILYKKTVIESDDPNELYGCFLFDDQFRTDSHPAEYFYREFLGFSTSENAKIQTQRFFDKTKEFIYNNIQDTKFKLDLLKILEMQLVRDQESLITPKEFADSYFGEIDIRDQYQDEVADDLPSSFEKDTVLISSQLQRKKITFPSKISISGPNEQFEDRVVIIQDEGELEELSLNDDNYTIVKIKGKPFVDA